MINVRRGFPETIFGGVARQLYLFHALVCAAEAGALRAESVSVRFGGVRALPEPSFRVQLSVPAFRPGH